MRFGIGPALATASGGKRRRSQGLPIGTNFSAWIGLVPKQHSSGAKDKLGSITKQGDRYLRSLFTAGALAVIRYAKIHGSQHRPWLTALLARRRRKVAAIALANKIALNGLGNDGQGRARQGTRRTRGVNDIALYIRRDVRLGGRTARNAERSIRAIGTTDMCERIMNVAFERDPSGAGHYGQRRCEPR